MSKEKQIEEMAKILCGMKNGCDGCMFDKAHCIERNDAEAIYNAGYRKHTDGFLLKENGEIIPLLPKQSEGEWTNDNGRTLYKCSVCGHTCPYDAQADDISYWTCNYCPNCGAKMRKEGEGK